MKVYAVVRGEKHQGGEIERIFTSRKKAVEEFYPQEVSNIESAQSAVGLLADKLQAK